MQRAETGDARLNRNHQSGSVNQHKEPTYQPQGTRTKNNNNNYNNNNNNNNDKEIFKASSSSNFYNNRNNGKEREEDYDDNVNVNQNRDYERKRKVVRNKVRRPVNNEPESQNNQNYEAQTRRSNRPTGFSNNFAGSSYIPTTSKPTTTTINNDQYTTAVNNYRLRNGQRQRHQFTSTDNNSPVPNYTISTPAPFRQTQYNTPPKRVNNGQYYSTTQAPAKETENYPSTTKYDLRYDIAKVKQATVVDNFEATKTKSNFASQTKSYDQSTSGYDKTENYPSNNPQYNGFSKKPTTSAKQPENYPTTAAVNNAKPYSATNLPTTFAPRTSAAYSTIAQQTINYNYVKQTAPQKSPSTPKAVPVTQYTPTVPKVSSTTPAGR